MKEVVKNIIAVAPAVVALLFAYLAKPFIYLSRQFSLLSIFLHETMNTRLGVEISKKKKEMAEMNKTIEDFKAKMQQALAAQRGAEDSDNTLANIIKSGNDGNKELPSNVLVLSKKDDNGNKN